MGHRREERFSRNVSILISMLVRYPEVGTVKYDPRQQTVRFSLLLRGSLTPDEFERLQSRLSNTLEVYNLLQQRELAVLQIGLEELGEVTAISITRDAVTLTPEEIWTITEFFREWDPDRLVVEATDPAGEEEMAVQDEIIEEIIEELEGGRSGRDLIAIREDGRVMVFHK